jgi:hypothetical protein
MCGVRVAALLLAFLVLGPTACSSCESVCEDLNECQGEKDCEAACDETERISDVASCDEEFDDWVECLSSVDNACVETVNNGECVFASNMFEDCLDVYCVRTRDPSACVCTDVSCGDDSPLPGVPVSPEKGD